MFRVDRHCVHTYSPALFNGPAMTFCEGMVWSDGVVSQEVVFTTSNLIGPDTMTTTTSNSIETISTVQSVNADMTSVETALFELLKVAEGEPFKEFLRIVK